MILFGGTETHSTRPRTFNDVWELPLTEGGLKAWSQTNPSGTPPSGIGQHAVYAPANQSLIVCCLGAWSLSFSGGEHWARLTPNGGLPAARAHAQGSYDDVTRQLVVVAGSSGSGTCCTDSWALALSGPPTWSPLDPSTELPDDFVVVPDVERQRLIGFRSRNGAAGIWILSLRGARAWTPMPVSGTPPSDRASPLAIYDGPNQRVIVFGGMLGGTGLYASDVWVLSLADEPTWAQPIPSGSPPTARAGQTAVYHQSNRQMVVFGGYQTGYSQPVSDVWSLSLGEAPTWKAISPTGMQPAPRAKASGVYDPINERIVFFGGETLDANGRLTWYNDTWALWLSGVPHWSQLEPTGTAPSARAGHLAVYDQTAQRMLVFGGWGLGDSFKHDVWSLSLASSCIRRPVAAGQRGGDPCIARDPNRG